MYYEVHIKFHLLCIFSSMYLCYIILSLHSKRSRTKQTKFGPRKGVCEKWGQSKTVEGRGWGWGKKGTLALKPLDFGKRLLVFKVEFIY